MRTITVQIPHMTAEQALAAWEVTTALANAIWDAWEPELIPLVTAEAEREALDAQFDDASLYDPSLYDP